MAHGLQHLPVLDLRVLKHLLEVVDVSPGNAVGIQRFAQRLGVPLAQNLSQQRPQLFDVREPPRIGREVGLQMPVGLHQGAERGELGVVANRQNHETVGALEHFVRRQIGVRVADALRALARHQIVGRLIGVHGHRHVEQRDVQMLALTGAPTLHQSREHRAGGIHAGHQIDHGDAGAQGACALLAIGNAGVAHQAAHALKNVVVAGLVRERTGLSKSRDGQVDQAGIDGGQRGVVEPVLGERADLVVLHQNVGILDLAQQPLAFAAQGKVERDRMLAAIARQKVRGDRLAAVGRDERWAPSARVIALHRALDLEHMRAQIGQILRAPRPRQNAR